MLKRFLTGLVIIALTVGCFALRFVGAEFFDAFVGVMAIVSAYEVSKTLKNGKKFNDTYFVMAFPVLCYLTYILCKTQKLDIWVYFVIAVCLIIFVSAVTFILNLILKNKSNKEMVETNFVGTIAKYSLKKALTNAYLMIYPAFILSIMFVINHLKDFTYFSGITGNFEFVLLVMLFVTTMATDTGAYLVGSGFKGKKLCPKISPNKTISGAIGGVLAGVGFSMLLYVIFGAIGDYSTIFSAHNITLVHFVIYGLVASIFTQFGDIYASLVKRQNNVKDYGKIFPGHGGIMDRVDGIAFNAVITLVFALICFM